MKSTAARAEPRTASRARTARPRVLVAGARTARVRAVARCLEGIRATVIATGWDDYAETLEPGFAAMIIAEPIPVSLAGAVAAVRGHPAAGHLAVFAVVDGSSSPVEARNAYLAGANAVIEWPREKQIFAGILAETMGMSLVRGVSTCPDVALCRTIRAHLRLGPSPGSGVRLSSRKGIVTVAGNARSLAELRRIVETIAAVPGVKGVLTSELAVSPSGIPDRTIARHVRAVTRATSEIDEKALPISVHCGRVKLRGVVPSRAALHDLLDLIANVKGVRDLDWQVTVSGEKTGSDAATARRLRRVIDTYHPGEEIEIAVLAGVAVLSGRAGSLPGKRAVERLASREDGVKRIVNKIFVEGS